MSQQNEGFVATLDVSGFTADEIIVQTDDRFIIIIGEHEEWLPDQGYVARHFIRRYFLPDTVDTAAFSSTINEQGLLTVKAPLKELTAQPQATVAETSRVPASQGNENRTQV